MASFKTLVIPVFLVAFFVDRQAKTNTIDENWCDKNETEIPNEIIATQGNKDLKTCYFIIKNAFEKSRDQVGGGKTIFSISKARALCQNLSATLLTIHSEKENDFVKVFGAFAPLGIANLKKVSSLCRVILLCSKGICLS